MRDPDQLPITPATVSVNGSGYGPRSMIWAGFRWHEAELRDHADMHVDRLIVEGGKVVGKNCCGLDSYAECQPCVFPSDVKKLVAEMTKGGGS